MKQSKLGKKWLKLNRKKALKRKKGLSKTGGASKKKLKRKKGRPSTYTNGREKLTCSNGTTVFLEELVVFLAIFNVSTRVIEHFCRNFFSLEWSRAKIQQIVKEAAKNAQNHLNKLDLVAREKTVMLNLDTTWKGNQGKVLGAIDPESGYVYTLDWVAAENSKAMKKSLAHLANICPGAEHIITDMSPAFGFAVPQHFPDCTHLLCQVHAMRDLFKSIGSLRKQMKDKLKQKRKAKKKLETTEHWLSKNRNNYSVTKLRLKQKREKKKRVLRALGYETTENGVLINKRQGLPLEVKPLAESLYKLQAREARYKKQVQKQHNKLPRVREESKIAEEAYMKQKIRYMVACRRMRCFFKLFYLRDQEEFRRKKAEWLSRLSRRNDALSKQMKSFLRTKSGLFPGEQGENAGVEKRYWNTNQVESLFARVKQTLHALRSLPNTPYIRARLTLLRWWLNTQGPLSGMNRNNPPIVRCGGKKPPFAFVEVG